SPPSGEHIDANARQHSSPTRKVTPRWSVFVAERSSARAFCLDAKEVSPAGAAQVGTAVPPLSATPQPAASTVQAVPAGPCPPARGKAVEGNRAASGQPRPTGPPPAEEIYRSAAAVRIVDGEAPGPVRLAAHDLHRLAGHLGPRAVGVGVVPVPVAVEH